MRRDASPPERSTYRHGDLRRALLEAGIQLARARRTRRGRAARSHQARRRGPQCGVSAFRQPMGAFASGPLGRLVGAGRRDGGRAGRGCRAEPVPPTPLVRACGRSAPPTCALPRRKRDCSTPPSRSPMKRAATPFRPRPGIAASIPFNCWAPHSTGCRCRRAAPGASPRRGIPRVVRGARAGHAAHRRAAPQTDFRGTGCDRATLAGYGRERAVATGDFSADWR